MDRVKIIIALCSFFWALVISVIALFLPPRGSIDSSVLVLIAQILILLSTIIGISLPKSFKDAFTSKKV